MTTTRQLKKNKHRPFSGLGLVSFFSPFSRSSPGSALLLLFYFCASVSLPTAAQEPEPQGTFAFSSESSSSKSSSKGSFSGRSSKSNSKSSSESSSSKAPTTTLFPGVPPVSDLSEASEGSSASPLKLLGYFDAQRQDLLQPEEVPFDSLTHLVVTNLVRVNNRGRLLPVTVAVNLPVTDESDQAEEEEEQNQVFEDEDEDRDDEDEEDEDEAPRKKKKKKSVTKKDWAPVQELLSKLRRAAGENRSQVPPRAGASSGPKIVLSLRGHPDDTALDEVAERNKVRKSLAHRAVGFAKEYGLDGLEVEWHSDDVAGGKPRNSPFEPLERQHYGLLVQDLRKAFRRQQQLSQQQLLTEKLPSEEPREWTLSVAVRPRKEELEVKQVNEHLDWLAVRAYGMRGLTDPHPSSLKDAIESLTEWTDRGLAPSRLVLSTPLFAKPSAALRLRKDNEAHHRAWRELHDRPTFSSSGVGGGRSGRQGAGDSGSGSSEGDLFLDDEGKAWWMSGIATSKAKASYVGKGRFGGLAFRDLHHDLIPRPPMEQPRNAELLSPSEEKGSGAAADGQKGNRDQSAVATPPGSDSVGTSLVRVTSLALREAAITTPPSIEEPKKEEPKVPLLRRTAAHGLSLLQRGLRLERSEKTQSEDL